MSEHVARRQIYKMEYALYGEANLFREREIGKVKCGSQSRQEIDVAGQFQKRLAFLTTEKTESKGD